MAFLVIALLVLGAFFIFKQSKKTSSLTSKNPTKELVSQKTSPKESYIFIPYWTIDSDIKSIPYDKLIYFGITADKNGIVVTDDGFKNVEKFSKDSGHKEKLLALRMLNTEINLEILKSPSSQKKIITEAVVIAQKYNFSGIVLDCETQGLPFETLVTKITKLHLLFAKEAHNNKLSFGTLLYGDTFYRIRPYDVTSISTSVDRVFVMAYDFSKAKGDPGPNFPLNGTDTYGYDFKTMVSDFLKTTSRDKLTIVFGMFGYDWKVDEMDRGKDTAVSKTTLQFQKFMTGCINANSCKTDIDKNAKETKIEYLDAKEKHVIWFENKDSVDKKTVYLHSQNLNSVGYWAYTYF